MAFAVLRFVIGSQGKFGQKSEAKSEMIKMGEWSNDDVVNDSPFRYQTIDYRPPAPISSADDKEVKALYFAGIGMVLIMNSNLLYQTGTACSSPLEAIKNCQVAMAFRGASWVLYIIPLLLMIGCLPFVLDAIVSPLRRGLAAGSAFAANSSAIGFTTAIWYSHENWPDWSLQALAGSGMAFVVVFTVLLFAFLGWQMLGKCA